MNRYKHTAAAPGSFSDVYLGDGRTMRRFKTRAQDRSFIRRHVAAYKTFSDPETAERQAIRQALAFGISCRSIAEILGIPEYMASGGRRSSYEVQRAEGVIRALEGSLTLWRARKRAAEAKAAMYGYTPKAKLVA